MDAVNRVVQTFGLERTFGIPSLCRGQRYVVMTTTIKRSHDCGTGSLYLQCAGNDGVGRVPRCSALLSSPNSTLEMGSASASKIW